MFLPALLDQHKCLKTILTVYIDKIDAGKSVRFKLSHESWFNLELFNSGFVELVYVIMILLSCVRKKSTIFTGNVPVQN